MNQIKLNMMTKLNKILSILVVALFFSIASKPASARLIYEQLPELKSQVSTGYSSSRCYFENPSTNGIDVKIQIKHSNYQNNLGLITEKSFKLGPKESREESIYAVNIYSEINKNFILNIIENDNPLKSFYIDKTRIGRGGYRYKRSALIDDSISEKDINKLFYEDIYGAFYADKELKQLPTDWVTYTQYDYIIYKKSTFDSFPEEVQKALFDYVRAGGSLFIIGNLEKPYDARNFYYGKENSSEWLIYSCRIGFGSLTCCSNFFDRLVPPRKKEKKPFYSPKEEEKEKEPEPVPANPIKSEDIIFDYFDGWEPSKKFNDLCINNTDVVNKLREYLDKNNSNRFLTIFVIILLVLICPANLLILKRLKKQKLIFITTPIIGLICGLLLMIYYFFGIASVFNNYRQSVTILNEKEGSAMTFAGEAFFTGRSRNEHIEFPLNSVIAPYLERDVYNGQKKYGFRADIDAERVIEFDSTQKLTKNWLKPNKPLAFCVTSQRQTDACVEINNNQGKLEIKNNLNTDIESIYIVSENGEKIYRYDNLKAGDIAYPNSSRFTCQKGSPGAPIEYTGFSFVKKNVNSIIQPGEYIAFLKSDPFLAQKFDSEAEVHELGCAVIGLYKSRLE